MAAGGSWKCSEVYIFNVKLRVYHPEQARLVQIVSWNIVATLPQIFTR